MEVDDKTFDVTFRYPFQINKDTGRREDTSRYTYKLSRPIDNSNFQYTIALLAIETSYSFPNITEGINNSFGYKTTPDGVTNIIYLPTGCYEITQLADAIRRQVGDDVYNNMILEPDEPLLKARFKLSANYRIDFTIPNNMSSLLGFNNRIVGGSANYYVGDDIVKIMHVNNIVVTCNIIKGSYDNNGIPSNGMFSFFPNVSPGFKIPNPVRIPIYYRVSASSIDTLVISILDQDGHILDLRGERVSLRFHLTTEHFLNEKNYI